MSGVTFRADFCDVYYVGFLEKLSRHYGPNAEVQLVPGLEMTEESTSLLCLSIWLLGSKNNAGFNL